jgi:retron-type reverse transcriptase
MDDYHEHLKARIVSTTITVKGMRLAILNAYAPTNKASETSKMSFYRCLNKAKKELDDSSSKYKMIMLGDLNATISSQSKETKAWDSVLGHNNSDLVDTNDNGERLLTWCLQNQMKLINTIFRCKRIHRGTWFHAATGKWKRLDYICTTPWVSRYVTQCRAYAGPSPLFDTDHKLLVMDISFPSSKRLLRQQISRTKTKNQKPRIDYSALRDKRELQQQLTEELDKELEGFIGQQMSDVNQVNEVITTTVKRCVENTCPKIEITRKKEPWEDDRLNQLMMQLRKCSDSTARKELHKTIKRRRKNLKNDYYKELADNINTAAEARDAEKEFAMAKKFATFKTSNKLTISNKKLETHFASHFAERELPTPPELERPEEFSIHDDEVFEIDESIPKEKEIEDVLKSFKNNKSSGTDKLKTEGLKYNDSKNLIAAILILLSMIWTMVQVPAVWLHANITCLFKKGLRKLAANYRGLSIGANMSRIIAKIIINRLKKAYEKHISEAQYGFRQNRSTNDAILVVKSVIEKYGETLIVVYIDLTAAYDHVPRDFLFRVLTLRTGAKHLIAILQKMYEGTTASIAGMKTKFDVLIGCRQGGQESPCIFNYYFDYVLKVAANAIDEEFPDGWGIEFEYNIPHLCSNREQRSHGKLRGNDIIRWILYADDVALFCKTIVEAEKLLNIINTTCNRFGLTISFKKTKTQVFNNEELAKKETLFSVEGNVIQNVKEFVYLGKVISNDRKVISTEQQTARATAKFNELRSVLMDHNVNMGTRKKLLEACVRSRLTYGVQAWLPKEEVLRKLEVCWFQCLRNMVKGGWRRRNREEGEYQFVYSNVDIQNIVKSSPLRSFIYAQHLKYIAHVCRAENTALTKKLLFAKPTKRYYRDPWIKMSEILQVSIDQAKKLTQSKNEFAKLVHRQTNLPPPL